MDSRRKICESLLARLRILFSGLISAVFLADTNEERELPIADSPFYQLVRQGAFSLIAN